MKIDVENLYETDPKMLRHWGTLAKNAGLTAITRVLEDLADEIETRSPVVFKPGDVVRAKVNGVWYRLGRHGYVYWDRDPDSFLFDDDGRVFDSTGYVLVED